ncbi:MAG: UDP-3-O-(3-hydroxymyristoyl)glucosamine N-acyltransferase [bacterium]|nr:UDP-3-O-(3-hydroxymyristoyl)glucosamine N-acyltransferase [bacterium]
MTSLKEIAKKINGELKGDPLFNIKSVNSIDHAGAEEITFCIKKTVDVETLSAGALIVGRKSTIEYGNLIYVDEPYLAFATLLDFFFPRQRFNEGIDANAVVAAGAVMGENVSIGAFSYVGEGTEIGDNCEIHSGVKIYRDVKIGKNCLIYSNVVIREEVEIGDNVVLQPGAVIGADGFGFTRLSDGTPVKIPQRGKVVIGNNCEIGANTCIDRSTVRETVLGDYVKLDNLVQVAHNVKIGKGTALSALCGVSGSVEIGENVIMGGQVGIADHAKITDGVMIAAKAGVSGNIKKRGIVAGIPNQDFSSWKRSVAIFRNLDSYIQRLKELEKKIEFLATDEHGQKTRTKDETTDGLKK